MFDLQTFTLVHVLISIAALLTGLPLLFAFIRGRQGPTLANLTIVLLLLTSLTGFGFPFEKVLPSHIFGVLSLVLLAVAIVARWKGARTGRWLKTYIVTLTIAVYLDAFVFVVQAFLKVPTLKAIAPTQESPVFAIAQGLLLLVFVALGALAVRGMKGSARA